jgi:hypothetical protein
MKSPVAHWGAREWRKNLDGIVPDPEHPQAFPMDLMGRIRVRLRAEDGGIVAYGFGGQRVALPAKSVGFVVTVSSFRTERGITHGRALLVLDDEDRILLRADGLWETYGQVEKVCRAAKVPSPKHVWSGSARSSSWSSASNARYGRSGRRPPRFAKAPGYVKVRTSPRGRTLRMLALIVLLLLAAGLGGFAGVLPAVALPEWFGAVRTLIGIVGVALGIAAGIWVAAAISHIFTDALRWAAASWAAGAPAPPRRFLGRRREHSGTWLGAANVGLMALVIALIGWGPGVGIASLTHGFRDAALVAQLRQHGSTTAGTLIDVPQYSTDSDGNTTETDVPTLSFHGGLRVTDPSIGGRPLPLNASDPLSTNVPETVVYLPSDPFVAAAKQQITGSVWRGAPTANLISGGLFTLALPPLSLLLVLRVRRLRWRRAKEFVDDLTS